jgi:hypothetical protein
LQQGAVISVQPQFSGGIAPDPIGVLDTSVIYWASAVLPIVSVKQLMHICLQ